jgi:hypothetical protein
MDGHGLTLSGFKVDIGGKLANLTLNKQLKNGGAE